MQPTLKQWETCWVWWGWNGLCLSDEFHFTAGPLSLWEAWSEIRWKLKTPLIQERAEALIKVLPKYQEFRFSFWSGRVLRCLLHNSSTVGSILCMWFLILNDECQFCFGVNTSSRPLQCCLYVGFLISMLTSGCGQLSIPDSVQGDRKDKWSQLDTYRVPSWHLLSSGHWKFITRQDTGQRCWVEVGVINKPWKWRLFLMTGGLSFIRFVCGGRRVAKNRVQQNDHFWVIVQMHKI